MTNTKCQEQLQELQAKEAEYIDTVKGLELSETALYEQLQELRLQHNSLTNVVLMLEPDKDEFCVNHLLHGMPCNYCGHGWTEHADDCPVTYVREVLKSQEVD